jgi:TPR repeat protein
MDWYLKAYHRNGDAINNIGVMYRDGLGVPVNRKISYLLFLLVHMEGIGGQITVSRANRNLSREVAELQKETLQDAVCYTMQYLVAYVESKGKLQGVPDELRSSSERKRIKELSWWMPGEVGQFECPASI